MADTSSTNNDENTKSPSSEHPPPAQSPAAPAAAPTSVPTTPVTPTPAASSSSWWGSWIDTAKSKSASVFEAVKKDLDELSEVVKTEASNASSALGLHDQESTVGVMKKSFSSFLGQMTDVLMPQINVDVEADAVILTKDGLLTLTGFPKHLAELQSDDKTYLQEPNEDLLGKYNRWLEIVEQDQFTENRIAKHLTSSQILNEKYLILVPDEVPHMEFWKRYLFKRALLEDAIANAEMAEKKAKSELNSSKTVSPEKSKTIVQTIQPKKIAIDEEEGVDAAQGAGDIDEDDLLDEKSKWEMDDFSAANIELSEEEQARLLEEYEQEIKEREKGKVDPAEDVLGMGGMGGGSGGGKKGKSTNQKNDTKVNTKNNKAKQTTTTSANNQTSQAKGNKTVNAKSTPAPAPTTTTTTKTQNSKTNKPNAATKDKQTTAPKANESKIVDNHFAKEEPSSNSDEDWEKFPTETEK